MVVLLLFSGSLFFVFFFILIDVEVFELIRSLGISNNTEPVTEVVSLQVFLGKIFQVSLGEVNISVDLDFGLGGGDGDVLSEVSSLSFDLDGSLQEFLEFANLHNTVFDWVSAIDGKSVANLLGLLSGLLHWSHFNFLVPIRQVC